LFLDLFQDKIWKFFHLHLSTDWKDLFLHNAPQIVNNNVRLHVSEIISSQAFFNISPSLVRLSAPPHVIDIK